MTSNDLLNINKNLNLSIYHSCSNDNLLEASSMLHALSIISRVLTYLAAHILEFPPVCSYPICTWGSSIYLRRAHFEPRAYLSILVYCTLVVTT